MNNRLFFTSESVGEGHPDKMADQISDAVLDALIERDPQCRVACETLVTTGLVVVSGEITTTATVDIQSLVRKTIAEIGFDSSLKSFDYKTCAVIIAINEQSSDISQGVTVGDGLYLDQGAGDQGTMFGYACRETKNYMPFPIEMAHSLMKRLSFLRKEKVLDYLYPDSKCQVTVEYAGDRVKRIDTIVLSTQHEEGVSHKKICNDIERLLIREQCPQNLLDADTKIHVNPTGRFVTGGPYGDCGLTGRKVIVDTYGGMGRHGGGCFSGKDPSKVDRSGAYMARYISKNLVAAGLLDRCEIYLSYSIGIADPVSLEIETFGTSSLDNTHLKDLIRSEFDLTPSGIIKKFDLYRPIYKKTAVYGHFGRSDFDWPWEKLDKVDILRARVKRDTPQKPLPQQQDAIENR